MTAKAPTRPDRPFRFTREQYHEMGRQGFFEDKRVELIFGEVVEMSPISWRHTLAVALVNDALATAFAGVAWIGRSDPIDLTQSEPQPDVAVFAGSLRSYTAHPTTALLVVEVADKTLANDTTTKAELYATAGIADYWVLDVDGRQLHVFRDPQPLPVGLGTTACRTHLTLNQTDRVSPLALPGAAILISDLLP